MNNIICVETGSFTATRLFCRNINLHSNVLETLTKINDLFPFGTKTRHLFQLGTITNNQF